MNGIMNTICNDKFKYIIAPLIVGVATSGLIWGNIFFYPVLEPNNHYFFSTLSVILYSLCFISFYKAITISNRLPNNLPLPRLKKMLRNNHSFYTDVNKCNKQNNKFKPLRTSHCSACRQCNVRMDHHCPYIDNCVGLKNLKAFILFTGYGGLFALEFLLFSIKFYFDLKNGDIGPFNQGTIAFWLFLSFCSFLLTLSMLGLATSNLFMASKNITQLDLMKGNFRIADKFGSHPNPFDLGVFTNINTIFDSDKWLFWWPTQIITLNDGTQYPMAPPVLHQDIIKLSPQIQEDMKTPFERSIPKTMAELRQKETQNYKNTIFFYLGKQYRIGDQYYEDYNVNQGEINKLNEQKKLKQEQYEKRIEREAQQLIQKPQSQSNYEEISDEEAQHNEIDQSGINLNNLKTDTNQQVKQEQKEQKQTDLINVSAQNKSAEQQSQPKVGQSEQKANDQQDDKQENWEDNNDQELLS